MSPTITGNQKPRDGLQDMVDTFVSELNSVRNSENSLPGILSARYLFLIGRYILQDFVKPRLYLSWYEPIAPTTSPGTFAHVVQS